MFFFVGEDENEENDGNGGKNLSIIVIERQTNQPTNIKSLVELINQ